MCTLRTGVGIESEVKDDVDTGRTRRGDALYSSPLSGCGDSGVGTPCPRIASRSCSLPASAQAGRGVMDEQETRRQREGGGGRATACQKYMLSIKWCNTRPL